MQRSLRRRFADYSAILKKRAKWDGAALSDCTNILPPRIFSSVYANSSRRFFNVLSDSKIARTAAARGDRGSARILCPATHAGGNSDVAIATVQSNLARHFGTHRVLRCARTRKENAAAIRIVGTVPKCNADY